MSETDMEAIGRKKYAGEKAGKTAKYQSKNRYREHDPRLWKPGEPLTEEDQKLLNEIRCRYQQLGYVPSKKEVASTARIRTRFRTWGDVLLAAGLPGINDPEQVRLRAAAKQ